MGLKRPAVVVSNSCRVEKARIFSCLTDPSVLARNSLSTPQRPLEIVAMPNDRIELAMQAIEAYLKQHPEAADSIEGIACWWLRGEISVEEVAESLDRLLGKGVIKEWELPDGRTIYVSASRVDAAKKN